MIDRDALILEHRRWAAGVAVGTVRDRSLSLSFDDAVSAAMVALVSCARRWQPGPATFRTYARHRIAGSVIDETRSSRPWSGASRTDHDSYQPPARPASLSYDEPGYSLAETVADIERTVAGRDRLVLQLLAQGLTLAEVGDRVGVSASRVCQIRQAARARLTGDPEPPSEPRRSATPLRDIALEVVATYRGATAPGMRSVVRHLHLALQARSR